MELEMRFSRQELYPTMLSRNHDQPIQPISVVTDFAIASQNAIVQTSRSDPSIQGKK